MRKVVLNKTSNPNTNYSPKLVAKRYGSELATQKDEVLAFNLTDRELESLNKPGTMLIRILKPKPKCF